MWPQVLGGDPTMVRVHGASGDGKTEPETRGCRLSRISIVEADERFEDGCQSLRRDAGAFIGYSDLVAARTSVTLHYNGYLLARI
jgi:hypothetical protein